jgi:beta-lactamase superfamily II metal-dependent hydrolase
MKALMRGFLLLFLLAGSVLAVAQSGKLTIYWVDTEGGAATLLIGPTGQSLLVDAGDAVQQDRDAQRIYQVAKLAGLKKIDAMLVTHFHSDHIGGVPALAKLIPIERYYDHGEMRESTPIHMRLYKAYAAATEGKRNLVQLGSQLPLAGVQINVVAADGNVIANPLSGNKPNPFCAGVEQKPADKTENQRSIGFLLTWGKFKYMSLGDLTWDKEMEVACPVNRLGTATLFQATHHGFYGDLSGSPALLWAVAPKVVIVNNGARKGLPASAYERIRRSPGIEGIWQLHSAAGNDSAHNTAADMIANVDSASDGHWIKAVVSKDGTFTVMNERNGSVRMYSSR